MRSAMKAVVAVSVALSTLGAVGQEAGGTKGVAPEAASEATPQAGYVFVPESSKEQPGRVHTTYVLRSFDGKQPAGLTAPMSLGTVAPAGTTEEAETPQSLGCLYVSSPVSAGCVPNYNSCSGGPSAAGYGAIALVEDTRLNSFAYWRNVEARLLELLPRSKVVVAEPSKLPADNRAEAAQ